MLQFIKRIQATRQFRRLVKPGCAEPLSGDELAQLEASWVQMRLEIPTVVAPAGAKYAFGWEIGVKRAPPRGPVRMEQEQRGDLLAAFANRLKDIEGEKPIDVGIY